MSFPLWKIYVHFLKYTPVATKTITSVLMRLLSHTISKRVLEKDDAKRANVVTIVALQLIYIPIAHYWYQYLDHRLFPRKPNSKVDPHVLKKLALDQLLFHPLLQLVILLSIGYLDEQEGPLKTVLYEEFWTRQRKSWPIWSVVQLVNFSMVPTQLRILYMDLIKFALVFLTKTKDTSIQL